MWAPFHPMELVPSVLFNFPGVKKWVVSFCIVKRPLGEVGDMFVGRGDTRDTRF